MRIYLGIFFIMLFGIAGVASAANADYSITMDTVGFGSKHTEGKATENWLFVASDAKTDWADWRMTGKFYVEQLNDDYNDTSDDADDLLSRIQVAGNFNGSLEGLEVKLGDKWNAADEILFGGVGYQWSPWEPWTFKVRYDQSHRERIVGESNCAYDLQQEEVSLKYTPDPWSYNLQFKHTDKDYPYMTKNGANYSKTVTGWQQELKWEVNERWDLGLDYSGSEADYLYRKDSSREKWTFKAGFKQNDDWDWDGSIYRSDYNGYSGTSQTSGLKLKGKYNPKGPWWLAASLGLTDYQYSEKYFQEDGEKQDLDGDFKSRQQRSLAVEYRHKLARLAYNIEIFVKQYEYENYTDAYQDGTEAGGTGTLEWEWGWTQWQLRVAPNGDLTTRKAKYELKATYQF